ncbi:MAG: D-2-hydroxyacid dehydrogenase, partial [Nakamurella sp.]
ADTRTVVTIASQLDAALVTRIAAVDDRLQVRHEPELLRPPPARGAPGGSASLSCTAEQQQRWRAMLAETEVLFGIPHDSAEGLAEAIRSSSRLRWIQATAGGAGQLLVDAALTEQELRRVQVTRAGGVPAGPLAEFAMFGLLAFTQGLPRLLADQKARRWEPHPVAALAGGTVLVVGLGALGAQVARLAKAFGMRVIAVNRTGRTDSPDVDEIRTPRFLGDLLPVAHGVVVTVPLTDQTRGMIGATAIDRMHSGAVLVAVGRGGVVDEAALVQALRQGRLAGAALDVFAEDPLPVDSPLWDLPNVLLSPHSAELSQQQTERIVAVFTENLRRYLAGDELLGPIEPARLP